MKKHKIPLSEAQITDFKGVVIHPDHSHSGEVGELHFHVEHEGLIFKCIYTIAGMLMIEQEDNPLIAKECWSEKDFYELVERAKKNLDSGTFEKIRLTGNIEFEILFQKGEFTIKYKMDPVTQLFAFQAVEAAMGNLLDRNDDDRATKLTGQEKMQHAVTRSLCKRISTKLADAVYHTYKKDRPEDEDPSQHLQVVSKAESRKD